MAEETKDTKPEPVKTTPKSAGSANKIAIVLIRSALQASGGVKETLFMLKLRQKNACVVVDGTPATQGMIKKVKDYVTYGEVSAETLALLKDKRGRKDESLFLLHPPRGGFERKGIKKPFYMGGALGFRKDKMGDLLKRMV